jgi:Zn-dependent M28 family amino/carboxypeptidase
MIEVLRALSSVRFSFKNSVIFLFNTAEEEGATGSHSFITQVLYSIEFL